MKRSKANLSHYHLTTTQIGKLIPVSCMEVLPGDTFQHRSDVFLRCSPLLAPVMHMIDVRVHTFYVPNRVVWDGWEDFITGQGGTIPTGTYNPTGRNEILSGLGLPSGRGAYPNEAVEFNLLPLYGFNKIYNEFYRDQDLDPERADNNSQPARVSWHKDYFTAARPFSQKGPNVQLPLGTEAPVIPDNPENNWFEGFSSDIPAALWRRGQTDPSDAYWVNVGTPVTNESMDITAIADLTNATAVDVNDVRFAFGVQRYAEARARFGSRYTEYLRYLGVKSSDSRLQRPEYLSGGKAQISFSEVLQTAEGTDPVGEMRGHGVASMRTNRYRKFFEEHGYVITLLSVVPRNIYADSTPRHFMKSTPVDYYQKELQFIGQQEVYNGELFPSSQASGQKDTWGWSNRYQDYLSVQSRVSGEFNGILDYWTMARQFDSQPNLNSAFTTCDPPPRQFADQINDQLWVFVNHHVGARRLVQPVNVGRII